MSAPDYPFPQTAYHGDYVVDLAEEISKEARLEELTKEEAITHCSAIGKDKMLDEIKRDLADFGMTFDVWYSETELFDSGLLDQTLEMIRRTGHLYKKDGALWIKTSELRSAIICYFGIVELVSDNPNDILFMKNLEFPLEDR